MGCGNGGLGGGYGDEYWSGLHSLWAFASRDATAHGQRETRCYRELGFLPHGQPFRRTFALAGENDSGYRPLDTAIHNKQL